MPNETPNVPATPPKSQGQRLYEKLSESPMLWGYYYLPKHFSVNSPDFHLDLINDALEYEYLAIAAPRGSSKTTILGFLYPFHCISFQKKHFIVILSNTFSQASMLMNSIKMEIKENQKLHKDFPIEITKDASDISIFRHRSGFETMIMCKGAEQAGTIRGSKFGAYRPDLILVDDVENDELVRSPERRYKLKEDYDNAVIPAGDIGTQYIVVGTIMHDDALLAKLVSKDSYKEYHKAIYKGLYKDKATGELFSLWDEKYPVEKLLQMMKDKPTTFAREVQNNPVSGSMASFKKEDFRYWRVDNLNYVLFDTEGNIVSKGNLNSCKAAISADLAWSERKEADDTVILPAFLTPNNEILIETYINKKGMRPDEFIDIIFNMVTRLRSLTNTSVPLGLEKAMLERVYQSMLRKEMGKRGYYFPVKELKWESDKITRIETVLQPRYAQHIVFHKQGMGDLEHQLLRFPSGAHDDLLDAAKGICDLLQYPKSTKSSTSVQSEDPGFDYLRKLVIDSKKRHPRTFTGFKKGKFEIKSIPSWR